MQEELKYTKGVIRILATQWPKETKKKKYKTLY